jgi:hypothetical protein
MSWAIPDQYRSRVNSMTTFMAAGITPIGIAVAGFLSTIFPVTQLILWYGIGIIVTMFFMFLIPGIIYFMNADQDVASFEIRQQIEKSIERT